MQLVCPAYIQNQLVDTENAQWKIRVGIISIFLYFLSIGELVWGFIWIGPLELDIGGQTPSFESTHK